MASGEEMQAACSENSVETSGVEGRDAVTLTSKGQEAVCFILCFVRLYA